MRSALASLFLSCIFLAVTTSHSADKPVEGEANTINRAKSDWKSAGVREIEPQHAHAEDKASTKVEEATQEVEDETSSKNWLIRRSELKEMAEADKTPETEPKSRIILNGIAGPRRHLKFLTSSSGTSCNVSPRRNPGQSKSDYAVIRKEWKESCKAAAASEFQSSKQEAARTLEHNPAATASD